MATDIGQAIKENRIKKGMTQADLADKVGLATITIRQYENGTREPKLEVLRKIAISLGVSIYSLVDFDGATSLLEQDMTESRIEYGSEWEQFVRVQAAFSKLNHKGAERAAEAVEDLAKIPEYQDPEYQELTTTESNESVPPCTEE